MNYLITGGSGLIGKALIESLLQHDGTITVLSRDINRTSQLFDTKVNIINTLSIADIENKDAIINLAGEPIADKRWSATQKHTICHSRWDITQKLANLIQEAKNPPSLFMSGSAIGIYGRQNNTPIDESFTQYNQEFTNTLCSQWEKIALEVQSDKTRVAILRTGIVLANNGGALSKMLLPFKLGLGGKMGNGEQMMSWIHIEDMVSAIIHIQNNTTLKGAINLTTDNAVKNKYFTAKLAKVLNRPSLLTTPAPIIKLLFGEMSDVLLFGQNVVPSKLKTSGFLFKYPTLASALENILRQN
jgi:uncharacterized protein (TIGR01777 family)